MGGYQLLVGGDDALAPGQGPLRAVIGEAYAAHSLHHHGHLRVVFNNGEVVNHPVGIGVAGKLPQVQDVFQVDLVGHPLGDVLTVFVKNLANTAADCAVTQNRYIYHNDRHLTLYCRERLPRGCQPGFLTRPESQTLTRPPWWTPCEPAPPAASAARRSRWTG